MAFPPSTTTAVIAMMPRKPPTKMTRTWPRALWRAPIRSDLLITLSSSTRSGANAFDGHLGRRRKGDRANELADDWGKWLIGAVHGYDRQTPDRQRRARGCVGRV